jgi:hypothetical protein
VDVDMASAYIHLAISSIPLRVFPIHLNFQDQKKSSAAFLSQCLRTGFIKQYDVSQRHSGMAE